MRGSKGTGSNLNKFGEAERGEGVYEPSKISLVDRLRERGSCPENSDQEERWDAHGDCSWLMRHGMGGKDGGV